jgi:demethylmenaquinone methyltransferase/2-methoxy-6-polyprenyl-1,4-benzoquinol methylase
MPENDPQSPESPAAGTAHFGYREVAESAKSGMVRGVFDSVAGRYDLMNDLMSGGIHRLWKSTLIDTLRPRADMDLLDVAGGTGDIAQRFLGAGGGHVTVCDINESMLRVGRDRAIDRGLVRGLDWLVGDAEALPLPDASVGAYTIAFGLRNVTHIDRALAEARRALRPGGRFLCLEFSHVSLPWLETIYDRYSFTVLPVLGAAVAGDRDAYLYLAESIRRFPRQDVLADMLTATGFDLVTYRNLSGGIAAIHSGWRL